MNKIEKGHKPTVISEGPGAKAGSPTRSLHTASPRQWTHHLSTPSSPTHWSAPTLTSFKEPARPPHRAGKGYLLLIFILYCCMSPSTALSEFLVWLLNNFYWFKSSRTLVSNNIKRKVMSICLITDNVNLGHLLKVVSAWFPHFYSFVINKYFVRDTLRLINTLFLIKLLHPSFKKIMQVQYSLHPKCILRRKQVKLVMAGTYSGILCRRGKEYKVL